MCAFVAIEVERKVTSVAWEQEQHGARGCAIGGFPPLRVQPQALDVLDPGQARVRPTPACFIENGTHLVSAPLRAPASPPNSQIFWGQTKHNIAIKEMR